MTDQMASFRCGDQRQGWAGGRRRWSATSRPTTPATTTPTTTGTRTSSQNFKKRQVPSFCKSFQEFPGVSRSFCKFSKVSKSFCKCSKTLLITNHTGSSSGETERSSATKHSSQRGRGAGERPREEGGGGEQRHHGGQVHMSSIIFLFLQKYEFLQYM